MFLPLFAVSRSAMRALRQQSAAAFILTSSAAWLAAVLLWNLAGTAGLQQAFEAEADSRQAFVVPSDPDATISLQSAQAPGSPEGRMAGPEQMPRSGTSPQTICNISSSCMV
jgi:hypothetical protein